MPFFLLSGYRFGFFSLDKGEPPHVHVSKGEKAAKIWLNPIEVEWNRGYNGRELNRVLELTQANQTFLLEKWHEHFSQ